MRTIPSETLTTVPSLGLSSDIRFLDALLDDFTNLGRIQLLHAMTLKSGFQRFGQLARLPRTEPSTTTSPARINTPPIRAGFTTCWRLTVRSAASTGRQPKLELRVAELEGGFNFCLERFLGLRLDVLVQLPYGRQDRQAIVFAKGLNVVAERFVGIVTKYAYQRLDLLSLVRRGSFSNAATSGTSTATAARFSIFDQESVCPAALANSKAAFA